MRFRKKGGAFWYAVLTPVLVLVAVICFLTAISNLESGRNDQGRRQLEDTIRQAAVTCYATEGFYPPTLTYLEEHYGLQVDAGRFTVYYNAFAENLVPDITVLENGE
jgi:hypothetical protein